MRAYLEAFADVKYQIVEAEGTGTCSGVRQALDLVPEHKPFMLVWSDLILPNSFELPVEDGDYIGVSQTFPCRWLYDGGQFREERSVERGVAGLFLSKSLVWMRSRSAVNLSDGCRAKI